MKSENKKNTPAGATLHTYEITIKGIGSIELRSNQEINDSQIEVLRDAGESLLHYFINDQLGE